MSVVSVVTSVEPPRSPTLVSGGGTSKRRKGKGRRGQGSEKERGGHGRVHNLRKTTPPHHEMAGCGPDWIARFQPTLPVLLILVK